MDKEKAEQKAEELLQALGCELGESRADYMESMMEKKPLDRGMFKECPTCGHIDIEGCDVCERCKQALDWGDQE